MKTAVLLAGLLLTASLVVAPTASAHHCQSPDPDIERACNNILHAPDPVVDRVLCFYYTAPAQWANHCL